MDQRRSKYNDLVRVGERLVLPRLKDYAEDIRELAAQAAARGKEAYLEVVDFEDAFYSLGLDAAEWPYLTARHPTGGFVGFRTALCGGR